MNLKLIQGIINEPYLDDESKRRHVLEIIAEDKDAVPYILEMLEYERQTKNELISEMNMELSRADTLIVDDKIYNHYKKFVGEEISKFYEKWKGFVGHCFRNKDKEK